MQRLLNPILDYKNLWLPLIGILVLGIFSNFLVAGGALLLYLLSTTSEYKILFLMLLLLATCMVASNLSANFGFAQNFRFVALGTAVFFLLYNRSIPRTPANYIFPFSIYATLITILFSPLGFEAILRGISYWLIALVIFVSYTRSATKEPVITSQMILGLLVLFLGINCILFFFNSGYLVGRFRGLMGNPNELGLLAVFSYGLLDLLKNRRETNFSKKNFSLIKLALIGLVIITGSRTALFGLVLYKLTFRLFINKFLLIISLGFIGAVYYLSLSIDIVAIIRSLGLSDELRVGSLTTGSGRTEVWKVAWEEIKKNPFFGRGMLYDNFFILEYGDLYMGPNRARHWYGIWNSYLSLMLDVGIIGLIAFLFFVAKMYRISPYKNLAAAFLAMTLFAGITESWMAASMNAFTPLFFLYWAIQAQPVKEVEHQE